MSDLTVDIIEFIDLINFTTSDKFIEKWRYRFSENFLRLFQDRILKAMADKRPIKKDVLYSYLTKRCRYSPVQVDNFFEAIEIEIYRPLVQFPRKASSRPSGA